MDSSRDADFKHLRSVIANPKKPRGVKRAAHIAAKKIVSQMRDRKLTQMRHRLVKAARAHDEHVEWKLTNQIRDYLKQERLDK